jgi:hypothetical protein
VTTRSREFKFNHTDFAKHLPYYVRYNLTKTAGSIPPR